MRANADVAASKLPEGCRIEELGRRARTMRLMRLSCPDQGYRRDIPYVAAPFLELPVAFDEALFDEAVEAALEKAALARVERLASAREQATGELRRRLLDEGFGEVPVTRALERAKTYGWVDDERFAYVFVSAKLAARWGSARILRELAVRGIDEDVARAALAQANGDDDEDGDDPEVRRAIEVLRRKPVSGKNVRDKLFRRLISRGYSAGVASEAVSQFLTEQS